MNKAFKHANSELTLCEFVAMGVVRRLIDQGQKFNDTDAAVLVISREIYDAYLTGRLPQRAAPKQQHRPTIVISSSDGLPVCLQGQPTPRPQVPPPPHTPRPEPEVG